MREKLVIPFGLIPLCLLLLAMPAAFAADESQSKGALTEQAIRERIAARFPGAAAADIRPTPVPGLYEVAIGPIVVYASADGRYLVRGEIYDMATDRNLTDARLAEVRAVSLAQLSDEEVIAFGKPDLPYTVTVFTDVTCTYCRLLHSKIEEYLSRGIRVRYAAFPRNGLASDAWQTMEHVWCANDRQHALTFAKLDREFEYAQCETDQVMQQWQLGRLLGVRGTPAIFTSEGEMIPGYVPPEDLLQRLQAMHDK